MPDDPQKRSQRERMLAGEFYTFDAELAALHAQARLLTRRYNDTSEDQPLERNRLLRSLLGAFGDGSSLRSPFFCDYGSQLHVGTRTFINSGLVALDVGVIRIGDDVQIGPNVQLLAATHPLDTASRRAGWESGAPITIGDGVWLGGGVIVCPGVTIGENTVVGAGSVVVRDLPPGVLAVGNPARIVRAL